MKTLKALSVLALIIFVAIASHIWTMRNLVIETDGDGDSAIISVAGKNWFVGINGYEPSKIELM